jgi:hypothetical protein
MYQGMKITNEDKIKIFYDWLGPKFNTFEQASEDAPISFLAKDFDDKEYYVHVQVAEERNVESREQTGIKIENTHFYQLYGMASQGMNVFWMEAFEDGYMLFYINDCLTAEQLKVTNEFTLIGVASALHIEKHKIKHDTNDGKSYMTVAKSYEPSPIISSSPLGRVPKRKK